MNLNLHSFFALNTVLGSLIGLTTLAATATAAPSPALNPCPGIYYEEPHNTLRIVPSGCPPNAATRSLGQPSQNTQTQASPTPSPLPEVSQRVIATVTPQAGQVNVRLRNATNTQITYQAIGHTEQRTLAIGEEIMLRNIPAPATLTFLRPDGGLISVTPTASPESSSLALMLNEAIGLDNSQNTVRIQTSGQVFAY
jgi:hypothetical protein